MTNKKRLFIHIGIDKAGSTSIQTFFRIHEKKLRKKKVYYFSKEFGKLYHFKIKALFQEKKSPYIENSLKLDKSDRSIIKKQLIQEIKSNIRICDTFIISHEDIFHYTENDYKSLVTFFSIYFDEIIPIFYLREYVSYTISKQTHKMKTFFGVNKNFYFHSKVCNYSDVLNKLQLCFKKVIYDVYDRENLYNNNIVDDFLQKCDLINIYTDKKNFNTALFLNKNLDTKSLINLYFLNKYINFFNKFDLKRLEEIVVKEIDLNTGRGIRLSKDKVDIIKKRTKEYEKILFEQHQIKFKDYNSYGPYTFSNFYLILGFINFIFFSFKILIYYIFSIKVPFIDK